MSGPKLFIKVQFDLEEFKPYTLSCQIDSGCQVNLAKGSALPFYYWEKTFGSGTAIHGTPVPIRGKAEIVPVIFGKSQSKLTFYRLDELKDDCLLGSDFLHQVSPYTLDHDEMTFTCYVNKKRIVLPLSFTSEVKCQAITEPKNASVPRLAKMEREIAYSETHSEKMLKDISEKLRKDCCSDSPNAFWKREKYFVTLPYDPL